MEIWKEIPNYEGIYEASNLGQIRTSKNKITSNKRYSKRKWEQRIIKPKVKNGNEYKTGYRVSLWKDGKPKDYLVARLVASTFIENQLSNKNLTVNHINGNRLDNRVENLEWCTLADNIRKGFETGLYSTAKKVMIINKKTGEKTVCRSLSIANSFINKNHNYINYKIKKNIFSDDNYEWQLL